jgi:hypothetical protein
VLKSVVMHDIPLNHIAAMERWYWRDHGPEIARRFGPWLARHESFLPVDAPPEARGYGHYNWRVTEGYWHELPLPGARGNLAFTLPPAWPRVATAFFPAQPTEDLCGGTLQPHERAVLRWYCLSRYPTGVEVQAAEHWFKEVHAPELARLGNPYRAFSSRALEGALPLPGEWPPSAAPPHASLLRGWQRLTELWFESFDDWSRFMTWADERLTPPDWADGRRYPYVSLGTEFVSTFLLERPTDEFSRDARGYL